MPRVARTRAGRILIACSDCAQVLPGQKLGYNSWALLKQRTSTILISDQLLPVSTCNAGWRTLGPSSLPLAAHRLPM